MKHGMLAAAVITALSVSNVVYAKTDIKDVSIQQQAKDFVATKDTISKEELIDKGRVINDRQSSIRIEQGYTDIMEGATRSEVVLTKTQAELEKESFILNNVPVQYRIAGEAEVQAYIRSKFIDRDFDDSATAKENVESAKQIWKNSDNNLVVPNSTQPTWNPVVREVKITPKAIDADNEPLEIELATSKEEDPVNVTTDDLAKLFEGVTLGSAPVFDVSPTTSDVFIEKIDIRHVLLTSRSQQVDVDVRFKVVNGDQKRTVEKTFLNIEPGYKFEIDNVQFELKGLSRNDVTFINLDTNKTFSHLVN
jgi:hypothetical protein